MWFLARQQNAVAARSSMSARISSGFSVWRPWLWAWGLCLLCLLCFPEVSYGAGRPHDGSQHALASPSVQEPAHWQPARKWGRSERNPAVLTYKYGNGRTGWNSAENILTTRTVNSAQFGKRVSYPVDGQIYAQPLYMPALSIDSIPHNVVFVATENDSVYAFNADMLNLGTRPRAGLAPIWHSSLLPNGATVPTSGDISCAGLSPRIGITGTPVIDGETNTLYVVTFTKEQGHFINRLHALDVVTGAERTGSPIVISATITGSGAGNVQGQITFDPLFERQRAALMLANGKIYMAWGGACDNSPYHGWIMSYTYNGTTLSQVDVYNDTPQGSAGGTWAAGALAADPAGNIYTTSGNGTFDLNSNGSDAGDSFLKLNASLQLQNYFTPFNQSCLSARDADLGSAGLLVLPTANELISGGKEGRVYVVNRTNMGHFSSLSNACSHESRTDVDQVVQEFAPGVIGNLFTTPVYWNGSTGELIYFASTQHPAQAYSLTNGRLSASSTSQTPESFDYSGGNPTVSSNGQENGSGIFWLVDPHSVLRAYDATNLSTELYNSSQQAGRDGLDSYMKLSVPTVAHGLVFVPTQTALTIYGLIAPGSPPPNTYNNVGVSDDTQTHTANYDGVGNSYSAQALWNANITPGSSLVSNGAVFTWPSAAAGRLDNYLAVGQTLTVSADRGATTLALLGSATEGSASGTALLTYSDNSTQPFTLGLTDWAQHSAAFGNQLVTTMPYRNSSSGKQATQVYLFSTEVSLNTTRTLTSVTLPPPSVTGGRLHVFALATRGGFVVFNNIGISDDSAPGAANFDGVGNSYSQQTLHAAHFDPDTDILFNGLKFHWPAGAAGTVDNYIASGQTIPILAKRGLTTLAFVGAADHGPAFGTAVITYTDQHTQSFMLGFSDWTLNAGHATPSFGNRLVASLPYRNTPLGKQTVATLIFYADVALDTTRTVKSITFPLHVSQGTIHIFAATAGPQSICLGNNCAPSHENT